MRSRLESEAPQGEVCPLQSRRVPSSTSLPVFPVLRLRSCPSTSRHSTLSVQWLRPNMSHLPYQTPKQEPNHLNPTSLRRLPYFSRVRLKTIRSDPSKALISSRTKQTKTRRISTKEREQPERSSWNNREFSPTSIRRPCFPLLLLFPLSTKRLPIQTDDMHLRSHESTMTEAGAKSVEWGGEDRSNRGFSPPQRTPFLLSTILPLSLEPNTEDASNTKERGAGMLVDWPTARGVVLRGFGDGRGRGKETSREER